MGKVKVTLLDGQVVEVDSETADALTSGKPGTAGAAKETEKAGIERERKSAIDRNANAGAAFLGALTNTAFAGIPGAIGLIPEGVKEDIEARPGAAFAGEIVSVLAPTGLLGKGAKAAGGYTVMGQATKLGAKGTVAARAGEGAIQSAAMNLSHVTISDDPFNAEAFLTDVTLGSTLNVAFGAAADRVLKTTRGVVKSAESAQLGEDAHTLVKLKQDEAKRTFQELAASPEYAEARDIYNAVNSAKIAGNNQIKVASTAFEKVATPEAVAAGLKKYESIQGKLRTDLKRMPADEFGAGGAVGSFDDLKAFTSQAESAIPTKPPAGSLSAVGDGSVEQLGTAARPRSTAQAGFEERMPSTMEDMQVRGDMMDPVTGQPFDGPLAERVPGMQMMRAETPQVQRLRSEMDAMDFPDSRAITAGERDVLAGRLYDGGSMSRTSYDMLYPPKRIPSSGQLMDEVDNFGKQARHGEHLAPAGLDDAARFADSSYQAPGATLGRYGQMKADTLLDAAAARRGGEFDRYAKGYRFGEPTNVAKAQPEQFLDDAADAADEIPAPVGSPAGSTPEAQLTPRQRLEGLNQELERVKAEAKRMAAEGDFAGVQRLFSDTNERVLSDMGGAGLPKPVHPSKLAPVETTPALPKNITNLIEMQDSSIERIAAALTPEAEAKLIQLASKLGQEAADGGTALRGIRGQLRMTKALSRASKVHLEAKAADLAMEAEKTGKLEWTFHDGDLAVKLTGDGAERIAKISGMRKWVSSGTKSMFAAAARQAAGGLKGILLGRLAYGAAGWAIGGVEGAFAGAVIGNARSGVSNRIKLKVARAFAGAAEKVAPLASAVSYITVHENAKRRDGRHKDAPAAGSLYDTKSVRAAIDAVHVQAATSPDAMYDFVKPLMGVSGDIAFGIANQANNALKYLSMTAPKDPGVDITPTGSRWEPTVEEAHEFLHRVEAVFNPIAYVNRVLSGDGHLVGVEALDTVSPGIVNMARTEAVNHMQNDLSPDLAHGLSMLMRGPVTPAQDPDLFLMTQALFASARGGMKRAAEEQNSSNPTGRPPAVQSPTAGSRVSDLTK